MILWRWIVWPGFFCNDLDTAFHGDLPGTWTTHTFHLEYNETWNIPRNVYTIMQLIFYTLVFAIHGKRGLHSQTSLKCTLNSLELRERIGTLQLGQHNECT